MAEWLAAHARIAVITGAGVSTASGIPDYRNREGRWKRPAPIQHDDFIKHAATRQRYWARSFLGWRHFSAARPNATHRALASLDRRVHIHSLITQNVDRLHQRAGSRHVIDLHGRLDRVVCLQCGERSTRDALQHRLAGLNPDWDARIAELAPDGDAEPERADYTRFRVPACERCGGVVKPEVVFYGGGVPAKIRQRVMQATLAADAVLVIGSSLMVWSAFRLVLAASRRGIPVVAINQGRTRADALLDFKLDAECGRALALTVEQLTGNG